jgi:AraC-like DNA-binding protein
MAGNRLKVAREAREAVQRRIVTWICEQSGTKQALCQRLRISASQLQALINEGVERCSLEYLLDVWERCGGTYSLVLAHKCAAPGERG